MNLSAIMFAPEGCTFMILFCKLSEKFTICFATHCLGNALVYGMTGMTVLLYPFRWYTVLELKRRKLRGGCWTTDSLCVWHQCDAWKQAGTAALWGLSWGFRNTLGGQGLGGEILSAFFFFHLFPFYFIIYLLAKERTKIEGVRKRCAVENV